MCLIHTVRLMFGTLRLVAEETRIVTVAHRPLVGPELRAPLPTQTPWSSCRGSEIQSTRPGMTKTIGTCGVLSSGRIQKPVGN